MPSATNTPWPFHVDRNSTLANKPPRVVALIQARMGSTRLPGKVLAPLLDSKPMLQWQLERLSRSKTIDLVIVATSNESGDTPIAAFCESIGVKCFRGSENNVLERFYKAACAELSPQERHSADNLLALLSRLQKQATQQVGAFSLRREVGMVLDDTLYLIKPLAQRYWSQTSALNDADQIFAAVVRANRRAQS